VNIVYWLPTDGIMAQANWHGGLVQRSVATGAVYAVTVRTEVSQCSKYNDSTINIVQVLLLESY